MAENLTETVVGLIDVILEKIEKPLSPKKPNVKMALAEINRIRSIRNEMKERILEVCNESELQRYAPKYTYKCLYQCGFATASIREIDSHLTNMHNHPAPQRDYSHPIYNET